MKRKFITNAVLLISVMGLTACPNNENKTNPAAIQQQAPPPGGNGANSGNPATNLIKLDPSIKSFLCEFEGQRYKNHKHGQSYVNIPRTTSIITLAGPGAQTVYLRNSFFGFDMGKFGTIYLRYIPAAQDKSKADTIILVNEGLNKNMIMTQSGYAGQEVKLEAAKEDLSLSVSCKGTTEFKEAPAQTGKTNLVCTGSASTALSSVEEINTTIPLNSIVAGEAFAISQTSTALMAQLDSAASRITYIANMDSEKAPIVQSTASLKSPSRVYVKGNSRDEHAGWIKVTCSIQ